MYMALNISVSVTIVDRTKLSDFYYAQVLNILQRFYVLYF